MNILLAELIIAIIGGWIVVIFADPYHELKQILLNKVEGCSLARIIIITFLPSVFLLLILLVIFWISHLQGQI
ncbi:MAG: hypothetical protein PHG05_02385 [Candidatus Nanoarchaeia archaeon]|nr:hypothetical protein [Candidatus Nanoarchaeia archaeon]